MPSLLGVLFLRYLDFMQRRMEGIGGSAIARGKEEVLAAAGVHHTIGLFVLFQYFFAPVSLVLIYFMVEGATRLVASMATKEAVGTLPLYLVSWIHGWVECAIEDGRFGPRIADELARGGGKSFDLRIASCRPKQAWNHLMVVSFNDILYEVVEEKRDHPPRPFVYLLRKMVPGKVVYKIHYYHPDEVLGSHRRTSQRPR